MKASNRKPKPTTQIRIICCGSRYCNNRVLIENIVRILHDNLPGLVIVEGEAPGADTLFKECAADMGIPVLGFEADWEQYGRAAGPLRNQKMLSMAEPHGIVAVHDDFKSSTGTRDMVFRGDKASVLIWLSEWGLEQLPHFINSIKERIKHGTCYVDLG